MDQSVDSSHESDVAVIGLGPMGAALAGAFLAKGLRVTVWNRSKERIPPIVSQGAIEADSLHDAVISSPLVLICVVNFTVSQQLFTEPEVLGVLAGRTVTNASTGSPNDVERFSKLMQKGGAAYIDFKLMFYPHEAGDSEAVIYVSGNKYAYTTIKPTLDALGGSAQFLGENAALGATLYNAFWVYYYSALFGFMECLAFVERSGLDVEVFQKHALHASESLKWHLGDVAERVTKGAFGGEQATLAAHMDGFEVMTSAFTGVGLRSRMLESIKTLAAESIDAGQGLQDVAIVVDTLRRAGGAGH